MNRDALRWVGIGLVVVGIVGLLVWGYTTFRAAHGLVSDLRTAEAIAAAGPDLDDLDEVEALLYSTRRHVVTLDRNVGWLTPLGPAFSWLPRVGGLAAEAPDLLTLADLLTAVSVVLWDDVEPLMATYEQGASPQELLPEAVAALSSDLDKKRTLVEQARQTYSQIEPQALPDRFAGPLIQLGEVLPLLEIALEASEVAPELLGLDEPATYLVLALNEDELRPTGGLISGVGEVRISAGDVVSMTFRDGYSVDDFSQPYPDPPEILYQFMALELWVFRDASWSPDFPTAVEDALPLYRPGHEVDVDGVVALDQVAVANLIAALGPSAVPGVDGPVTESTMLAYFRTAWAPDEGEKMDGGWWRQRKSFMGDMATTAMQQLESGQVDWTALGQATLAMLEQRHLQIMFLDEDVNAVLAEAGWDAHLPTPPGDLLAVAEANVGYNKASSNVARHLSYEVDLSDRTPQAMATLSYEHLSQQRKTCQPGSRYDPTYEEMMHRCYWAYVRLFVPEGAELLEASEHPIPADLLATDEAWDGRARVEQASEHEVFAQAMLLPTAAEEDLRFTYALPESVVLDEPNGVRTYRLLIRKQAGIRDVDVHVALRLPQDAVVLAATPAALSEVDDLWVYETTSTTDISLMIRYQLEE